MKSYLVRWEIDIEADSPEEAAARALIVQRDNDPANSATVFAVAESEETAPEQTTWDRWHQVALNLERENLEPFGGPSGEYGKGVMRYYDCPCGHSWSDEWDCACDDRCPKCDTSCSPTRSEEVSKPRVQPLTPAELADITQELLEALRFVDEYLDSPPFMARHGKEPHKRARAAIAKAEGREVSR